MQLKRQKICLVNTNIAAVPEPFYFVVFGGTNLCNFFKKYSNLSLFVRLLDHYCHWEGATLLKA